MIVANEITEENKDKVELEIATKIVMFERKLTQKSGVKSEDKRKGGHVPQSKVKLTIKHKNGCIGPDYNFDLEVETNLTFNELARAIGEVCTYLMINM